MPHRHRKADGAEHGFSSQPTPPIRSWPNKSRHSTKAPTPTVPYRPAHFVPQISRRSVSCPFFFSFASICPSAKCLRSPQVSPGPHFLASSCTLGDANNSHRQASYIMPQSRVAMFLGFDVGATVAALLVVVLRVGYRGRRGQLTVSDYLISTAMVLATIHMILDIIITASFGYGRHQRDLPPELQGSYKTLLMFWLIQIFTKLPLLFSKLSLTFVYRDLMHLVDHPLVKLSRVVNYVLMIALAGFFTAATLVSMFACTPIYKSWLPKTPGHCIDTTIMFNYVTSSVNISTSICLICIPLPVLYLAKNKRIEIKQLTALILFGLVDTIISIVRLYLITDLYGVKKDFTWLIIPTHIMIVVEMNMTIIAASLVVMRPCFQSIFDILFPGSRYTSQNRSQWDSKYPSRRSDGYVISRDEAEASSAPDQPVGRQDAGMGIVKTVDIELASNHASTDDILKANRLRNKLDRPEWHKQ